MGTGEEDSQSQPVRANRGVRPRILNSRRAFKGVPFGTAAIRDPSYSGGDQDRAVSVSSEPTQSDSKRRRPHGVQLMNVRPLHDRIIVRRLEEGEQQIGGIII